MPPDDVRARLLRVATALFAQRGYARTSVRELAEAAGTTKPTLYYWFQNKEALYLEALDAVLGRMNALVLEALSSTGPLEQRLHRFVEAYVGSGVHDPDGVLLALRATHPAERGQPTVNIPTLHLEAITPLSDLFAQARREGVFRDDIEPMDAVLALLGASNMHLLSALHGIPLESDYPSRILDTFLRGVKS